MSGTERRSEMERLHPQGLGGVGYMTVRRKAFLLAGLLSMAAFANAASQNGIRITVLDSVTRSVSLGGNDVPKNCDQVNFDAYCNNSKSAITTNTLLVQEGNNPPFRVACTVDSKYSRCTPLTRGKTFDARREEHGITVYYQDARKQLYTLVDTDGKAGPSIAVVAVATQPPPSPAENSAPVAASSVRQTVKCSFSSTPAGAEITIDGRYVGSTPSEIGLTTGGPRRHLVAPGLCAVEARSRRSHRFRSECDRYFAKVAALSWG